MVALVSTYSSFVSESIYRIQAAMGTFYDDSASEQSVPTVKESESDLYLEPTTPQALSDTAKPQPVKEARGYVSYIAPPYILNHLSPSLPVEVLQHCQTTRRNQPPLLGRMHSSFLRVALNTVGR